MIYYVSGHWKQIRENGGQHTYTIQIQVKTENSPKMKPKN